MERVKISNRQDLANTLSGMRELREDEARILMLDVKCRLVSLQEFLLSDNTMWTETIKKCISGVTNSIIVEVACVPAAAKVTDFADTVNKLGIGLLDLAIASYNDERKGYYFRVGNEWFYPLGKTKIEYSVENRPSIGVMKEQRQSVNESIEGLSTVDNRLLIMQTLYRGYKEHSIETFGVIALNEKGVVIDCTDLFILSRNAVALDLSVIFNHLVNTLEDVREFIAFHNHPSGSGEPSEEDFAMTKKLTEIGSLFGITMQDHLVIAEDGITSAREGNMIYTSDELQEEDLEM